MRVTLKKALQVFILSLLSLASKGQELKTLEGIIRDESLAPVPYATVTLINPRDSVILSGTYADDKGLFKINTKRTSLSNLILMVSSINYYPKQIKLETDSTYYEVVLSSKEISLNDVVVVGHKTVTKLGSGSLIYSVSNTPLEKLGHLPDIIRCLPLVQELNGKYSVMGLGIPVFYINGRKITNPAELKLISSEDVKSIEMNYAPDAEYESSVRCVIKITTKNKQLNGLGVSLSTNASYCSKINTNNILTINYKINKLDLFALSSFTDARETSAMNTEMSFKNPLHYYASTNELKKRDDRGGLIRLGSRLQLHQQSEAGFFYEYSKNPYAPYLMRETNATVGHENVYHSFFYTSENRSNETKHYINAFANLKLKNQNEFHFNIDILCKNSNIRNNNYQPETNGRTFLLAENKIKSYLLSSNAWYSARLFSGTFKVGLEYTLTNFNQHYSYIMDSDSSRIHSTSRQILFSPYISCTKKWDHVNLNIGLRHEFVDYQYKLNNLIDKAVSQKNNTWGPYLGLQYIRGKNQFSLSYRVQIVRPSYRELNSTLTFVTPYAYQSGNSKLKMSVGNIFDVSYSYSPYFLFRLNYNLIKDNTVYLFKKVEDTKYIFIPYNMNIQSYSVTLTYFKRTKIWVPNFTLGINGQILSYEGVSYNHPLFVADLKNIFTFNRDWAVNINLSFRTDGNINTTSVSSNYYLDAAVNKRINKMWSISIGMRNALGSLRDNTRIYNNGVTFWKKEKPQGWIPYITIDMNINDLTNRYSRKKVSTSELNRL